VTDVVVDASIAARALLEVTPDARELRRRLGRATTHAPHLIDAEVGSVMRKRAATGDVKPDIAAGALHLLDSLVVERYPHGPLSAHAWSLRHNLTYYDALYVALAARLGIALLTADARLARAPGLTCAVELIG
jgi:predicted nucleic acid-binding protein